MTMVRTAVLYLLFCLEGFHYPSIVFLPKTLDCMMMFVYLVLAAYAEIAEIEACDSKTTAMSEFIYIAISDEHNQFCPRVPKDVLGM